MEAAVTLLTVVCYGLALYLWWLRRTPLYLFTILAGHIGSLATPLWSLLYGVHYASDMSPLASLFSLTWYKPVVVAAAWYYTLPVLIVFFLYGSHWWFSGYLTGLITYGVFFVYHLVLEIIGLRLDIWAYATTRSLPFGISSSILSVMMAALVSFGLLYLLLLVFRYAWLSLLLVIMPSVLLLAVIVRGLLGAPLWISLLFRDQSWAGDIGMISTLGLLIWGVHIIAWGLARVDRGILV